MTGHSNEVGLGRGSQLELTWLSKFSSCPWVIILRNQPLATYVLPSLCLNIQPTGVQLRHSFFLNFL